MKFPVDVCTNQMGAGMKAKSHLKLAEQVGRMGSEALYSARRELRSDNRTPDVEVVRCLLDEVDRTTAKMRKELTRYDRKFVEDIGS